MQTQDKKIKKLLKKYCLKVTIKWLPVSGLGSDAKEKEVEILHKNIDPIIFLNMPDLKIK